MIETKYDDMRDDEIRVIGSTSRPEQPPEKEMMDRRLPENRKNKKYISWKWFLLIGILLSIIGIIYWLNFYINSQNHRKEYQVYRIEDKAIINKSFKDSKATIASEIKEYVEEYIDTANSVGLRILQPTGGAVKLHLGPLEKSEKIVMAALAADIRADNGGIAGAYVYEGELLSRGHSKQGFCAIIDGELFMGRQAETPLLERALEQDGYFFRQYSLVHNEQMGETTPAGRSVRRALCILGGQVTIIESLEAETYTDFSEALIEEGVSEAVALMGSVPLVMKRPEEGNIVHNPVNVGSENENYVVWELEQ